MNLPANFVNEGLQLAQTSTLFGIPMESLSREELLAAAAQGWAAYNHALMDGCRSMELMGDLVRARATMGGGTPS